jgi:hypothetical protein
MNPAKEDLIYEKAHTWSRKERNILVQMTKKQIELEAEDHSRTISWNDHWANVSAYLTEKEYSRTQFACKTYWHRVAKFNAEGVDVRLGSPESSEAPGSASNSLDDSYSSKRCFPPEMETCSDEGTALPSKKPRVEDLRVQDAVGSSHVRFGTYLSWFNC